MKKTAELHFAGHETFTLKQLWLRKAVRFAQEAQANGGEPNFRDESAILKLGLGKNMVSSLRFWSVAGGFLDASTLLPTETAVRIFGNNDSEGLDPFMQSQTTAWLVHWNLCSDKSRLTVFWFLFNRISKISISRSEIAEELTEFAKSQNCRVTANTIKRDVEVCLRSYAYMNSGRGKEVENEECAETLFGNLGLMQFISRDIIEITRSRRYSLPTPFFLWCILDMWEKNEGSIMSNSLDWYQIAFAENSPGRVFKLSEADLNDRLESATKLTGDILTWTDQLGIKSLVRTTDDKNKLRELKDVLLTASY